MLLPSVDREHLYTEKSVVLPSVEYITGIRVSILSPLTDKLRV